MAIKKIDQITINGRNQAFGGYIYSASMEVGMVDQPTQLTVNFVNESGVYLEPDLSVDQPYSIQIGNIVADNFFAIKRVITKSSGGRVLEVTFKDGSIILDRLWVGLNKRMGSDDTAVPGLIIVGREIHPCDYNEDGVFDAADAVELQFQRIDPCELKCPADENTSEPIVLSCIDKELTDIMDVKYSFKDLLDALNGTVENNTSTRDISYGLEDGTVITYQLPPVLANKNTTTRNRIRIRNVPAQINTAYLSGYTGSLREVLRSWCADFGWSFYWEKDALNFIDTTARPQINLEAFDNIESISDTRTLEGTVSRGMITHYGEPGIFAKADCSNSKALLLHCLTLGELFGLNYRPSWRDVDIQQTSMGSFVGGVPPVSNTADVDTDTQHEYLDDIAPQGVAIDSFEKSVVCSYYSEELRHLYNLWEYYGIRTPDAAKQLLGKTMDRLGQMKMIDVLFNDKANPSSVATQLYNHLLSGYSSTSPVDGSQVTVPPIFNPKEKADFINNNGYFVLAYGSPNLLQVQQRVEQQLASEFMGQHWYRAYASPYYGETPQIAPNGQYFGSLSTEIRDLPFAQFRHTSKSSVSQMVSSFQQIQKNDFVQHGALRFTQPSVTSVNTAQRNVRSMIYFRKQAVWMPLPSAKANIQTMLDEITPKMFKLIKLDDREFISRRGKALNVKDADIDKLQIYALFPGQLKIESALVNNQWDENPIHVEGDAAYSVIEAGLLDKKCAKYTINGVPIYTPAGASVKFEIQHDFSWSYRIPDVSELSHPTYRVLVSNTTKNRGFVSKVESVLISPPPISSQGGLPAGLKCEYQVREINRGSIRYLNRLEPQKCRIPDSILKKAHEDFSKNLNFSVNEPYRSIQYRIMGLTLPSKISIKDGLENLSVRIDEKGVFTDITIGNSLFTPPSTEFLTRTLELGLNPELYNNSRKNPL